MLPFLTTKRSPSGNVAKAAPLAPQDALKGAQWSTTAGGTQCPSQRRDPLSLTAYKETMKTTELRSSRWCMAGEWRAVSASWTKRAWDWIQENIFHREDRQAIEPVVRMGGEVSSLWSFHILSGTWAGWEGAPGTGRGGGGRAVGALRVRTPTLLWARDWTPDLSIWIIIWPWDLGNGSIKSLFPKRNASKQKIKRNI